MHIPKAICPINFFKVWGIKIWSVGGPVWAGWMCTKNCSYCENAKKSGEDGRSGWGRLIGGGGPLVARVMLVGDVG